MHLMLEDRTLKHRQTRIFSFGVFELRENAEKYQLENLPKEIAKLEEENKAIEIALGNSNLYTDDPQKFDELTSKLAANKALQEEKENRWLELQIKADELES